jgi:O-antigen/teichoic acid export membrane protein
MRLSRGIYINYLGRLASVGSIYLFIPYYVRILGIEQYGIIALYSIILTFTALADVGLSASFAREAAMASHKSRLIDLLTTIERVLLAATSAVALAIIVCADLIATEWLNSSPGLSEDTVAFALRLMALTLPFQLAGSLYTSGLLGLQHHGRANAALGIFAITRSGLVLVPLAFYPSLITFFGWHLFVCVAYMLATRSMLVRSMGLGRFAVGVFSFARLTPIFRFAGGMLIISAIASINTQVDKIFVSSVFSVREFGYYALASTLAQLPAVVTSPIMIALLPLLTSLSRSASDQSIASDIYRSYSFVVALLSSIASFGILFFSHEILSVWLGQSVVPNDAERITQLLAIGGLFLSLASMPYYFGLSRGHNKTSVILGLITLVLTIPLLFFATSRFGLAGATFPWVILNGVAFLVLSIVINRRYYSGGTIRWMVTSMAVPVGAGAAITGLARLGSEPFSGNLLTQGAVAAAVTMSLLLAIGVACRRHLRLT